MTIFNASSSPIFVCVGPDLVVEFANDATLKAWGKDSSVIGKPIIEGVPELKHQPFPNLLLNVLTTGIPYESKNDKADFVIDGQVEAFYFKFTYKPLKDENGLIWGVLCTATDVTELVLAKRSAEESQIQLRSMIRQAPVAICILEKEHFRVQVANDLMIQLWGATRDIIGKPIFEGLPELRGQGFEQLLEQVLYAGDKVVVSEMPAELPRKGEMEKVYLNFVYEGLKQSDGSLYGIMVVATEVTQQVQSRQRVEESERQFKQIADSMPQIVWVTDASGYHEYFNERWYDFTGSNFTEARGQGWAQMFHPDDRDYARQKWKHSLETGETYEIEYRLRNGRTEEYTWFLGRAVPIYNEDGKITKWFGTCTDINEQKQLQQQKDDFIGIASHELKTPLTTLKASLQLIERLSQKNNDHTTLAKLVSQSNKSINKLGFLVEDLLNVTKIREGQISLNKEKVILSELINDCCQHIRLYGKQNIIIEGDLGLEVFADANRIDQVIVNLVNNAAKYAPLSQQIHIDLKQLPQEARVSVTDQGPGISPEKIPHLFDRYFRVDSAGNQISGLGLGLYISNEIIKRHGGKMGVETQQGQGSTFWFTLPL